MTSHRPRERSAIGRAPRSGTLLAVGDYRVDRRTRCTKCGAVAPAEELFHTIEGDALCTSCKLGWAEAQEREARSGGVDRYQPRPGFRLVCPRCELASMETRENDFMRVARCVRCSKEVQLLRSGAFLAASLVMMGAVWIDLAARLRLLLVGAVLACALAFVIRDQIQRKRHRAASLEEIEHADIVSKEERRRAAERLRVVGTDDEAAITAAVEAETAGEAEASEGHERAASR